ncbi:NADP-dependent oxidoreductase [Pedomonas mirosovicensis]|uniref:NADP-dependent oxidoreductase n=1 Tax=Pedomonas mirosovicensis TaxID=2908641 RepID=UPI002167217A|nr:NADP-dependent oxidoreductase [Pedomonas mirosovicensis]MCH8683815.1 NADP-dependent oxidoreductase [Pedomonas mirosovicensis]
MKAAYYARFGGAELLNVGDLPEPELAPGEVLIRVRAAGVNPVDWKIRQGQLKAVLPYAFPIIPGWDAAGEVAAVGEGVKGLAPGMRVMACTKKPLVQWGACAEYVTVPAAAAIHTPQSLDDTQAAALPVAGLTAWQALRDFARIEAGQTVLIHGAAGGVGSLAVGIARERGASVIGTASPANGDYLRELGADSVIDYGAPDLKAGVLAVAPEGVDMVLDTIGGETLELSYALVKAGGTLVSLCDQPDHDQCAHKDLAATRLSVRPDGGQLAELAGLVASGAVSLPEIETLPLERIAEAHRRSEAGHVRGKLVLTIS